ncbi:jg25639 [Pararge aegeria aegeria]|uniref:RNA-directed DNA polymerase n=1 Tax=Pararge aegeria aegeria TaxID=348720 RepID=A0A8S4QZJ9_9NEOP|nr:jg25639 [Pararge aegeria aegeria]
MTEIEPREKWEVINLPSLKGFGNTYVRTLGKTKISLMIDNAKLYVEAVVVPDSFLNYDLLIGQTATEQPHILVFKSDKKLLIIDKQITNDTRLVLKSHKTVMIDGCVSVKVVTDTNFSGSVFVENGHRLNYSVETGVYNFTKGIGHLTILNYDNKIIRFNEGQILARAYFTRIDNNIKDVNRIQEAQNHRGTPPLTLEDLYVSKSLDSSQVLQLINTLNRYRDCFAIDLSELGQTTITEMNIQLGDSEPVVYRPYKMSHSEREEVRNIVEELLKFNIIRESQSPYASPVLLVKKKTGDKRLCVDYRALNRKTIKQHYPLPRIEDQIDRLAGNKYFCALDLASGYYQIPLAEESKSKSSFVTPDGQFEFNRMPFGLANAPAVFQRTINLVLGNLRYNVALAYMDDVLIPSRSFEEGLERLELVLKKFREAGLTLKPQKCYFFENNVDYLGFEISSEGVRPGIKKIESVKNFPKPKDVHNVRQFVGLASFFRRFIRNFGEIARPLTKLLKKNSVWEWSQAQEEAFKKLKHALISRPLLAMYNPTLETQIHTDASKHGIGSVLLQKQSDGVFKPVAYYSRQTSPEESHFSSYELESLISAVIAALVKFRTYVLGLSFTIVTDCNSLRATFLKRDMIPRVARWWSLIQEYDCNVVYKSGKGMIHVDALSRNPTMEKAGIIQAIDTFDIMTITDDWLTTVQLEDSEIQRIKKILTDKEYNNLLEIHKNFVLKRERVYRITEDGLRWVVPKGCRWQILQKNHDEIGHFAFDKTLDKIKQHYWFPRMRRFVKKYVNSCLECALNKLPAGKKQGFLHPIPKETKPFHTIHVDHLGPFVISKRKNCYILVIVESFTKFIVLKAVKNTKSTSTITVLRDYFGTFGLPKRLISDRGTSFTSSKFKSFLSEVGVHHIKNAVASPRANGQVERYNRTILDSLAAQNHGKDERLWDDRLLQVQWGLNNTINKGTGKAPSEVLFGLRLTGVNEGKLVSEIDDDVVENEASINCDRLRKIRDEVDEHTKKSQEKQKDRYNKKRKKTITV